MKLIHRVLLAILALCICVGSQAATKTAAEVQTQEIESAKAQGVELGTQFTLTTQRTATARALLKVLKVDPTPGGAFCQIECSVGGTSGIVCPVGESCNCSCMGGGPDCICRKSRP